MRILPLAALMLLVFAGGCAYSPPYGYHYKCPNGDSEDTCGPREFVGRMDTHGIVQDKHICMNNRRPCQHDPVEERIPSTKRGSDVGKFNWWK